MLLPQTDEEKAVEHMWAMHEEALLDQPDEANPAKAFATFFMKCRQYVWEASRGI